MELFTSAAAVALFGLIVVPWAAYRLTQFFVFDTLIGFNPESGSRMSDRVDRFAYEPDGSDRSFLRGKLGDLLTCPWCLGFWISVACWLAFVLAFGVSMPVVGHVLAVFAVAGVQGFLQAKTAE